MRNVIHFVFLKKWFGFCLLLLFFIVSCKTLDKPVEFVDSLRSPTSFPDLFFPTVKDIDAIIQEDGLLESETVKITPVGKNKSASIHVVQIQKDAEMGFYSHKLHDELVYVHKGSGIVELNDTRYNMEKGMVIVIPRKSWHRLTNTGEGFLVTLSFFSPPFDNKDIRFLTKSKTVRRKRKNIYDKSMKKNVKAEDDESKEKKKWLGFWGKKEEKAGFVQREQAIDKVEEQRLLVLTDEGKQKIKEVQERKEEREREVLDKIIASERIKVLEKLKVEGLISQEEFEAKRDEMIHETR